MQKSPESLNIKLRHQLQTEFSRRLRSNPRYSIRGFAAHAGIDPSTLSGILSGKRMVSEAKIRAICEKVGLPEVSDQKSDESNFHEIEADTFAVISDWHHFAILDLALLKSFKNDSQWIARKLSIAPHEARSAIERLKRLGMLVLKDGKLSKGKPFNTNYSEGVTSAAHKEYQRQIIRKALEAIDQCPQEQKDITSITMAADSRKLEQAKQMIKQFRRDLALFMEDGEGDSVYHFALQLYPVTNPEN